MFVITISFTTELRLLDNNIHIISYHKPEVSSIFLYSWRIKYALKIEVECITYIMYTKVESHESCFTRCKMLLHTVGTKLLYVVLHHY